MTTLERATAAVMKAMGDGPGSRDYLRATAIARAVLQAIREPSEAMVDAAAEWSPLGSVAREVFPAMIDAALEEG